jgi:hypothetical protein
MKAGSVDAIDTAMKLAPITPCLLELADFIGLDTRLGDAGVLRGAGDPGHRPARCW